MKSICFTGHRAVDDKEQVRNRLIQALKLLINDGITDFYTGGAIGFDTLADCCVCYYDNKKSASGTGQTVRMAERKNIRIINLLNHF